MAQDGKRLIGVFILNQASAATQLYHFAYVSKRMRVGRVVTKIVFIGIAVFLQLYTTVAAFESKNSQPELGPMKPGMYDVRTFVMNKDTIPASIYDSLRWKDIIFEGGGGGSVNSIDTLFRQRYRRGYFFYKPDTAMKTISLIRFEAGAERPLFVAKYELAGKEGLRLWAKIKDDSIYVELIRSTRKFQLAERQFHWVSEYGR